MITTIITSTLISLAILTLITFICSISNIEPRPYPVLITIIVIITLCNIVGLSLVNYKDVITSKESNSIIFKSTRGYTILEFGPEFTLTEIKKKEKYVLKLKEKTECK